MSDEMNPSNVTIRLIEPTDSIEVLTALINRAYTARHAAEGRHFLGVDQDVQTTRRRIEGGECFVAVIGGRIVGTQTLHYNHGLGSKRGGTPWYDQPGVARSVQLAVDPECQGRGIANLLKDHTESRARELGMAELARDTSIRAEKLIAWYTRCGFRVVDYTYWPTTNYCSVVMSKRLRDDSNVKIGWLRCHASRWRNRLRQLARRVIG